MWVREGGGECGCVREEEKVWCVREEEKVWCVREEEKCGYVREEGEVWIHEGGGESGNECGKVGMSVGKWV